MKISTNIPTNDWNSFIDSHPNGTIFQSPAMFALFEKTNKFEPLVIGVFNETDVLCGVLLGAFIHERNGIGKLLSSRFVVYGGPLLSENKQQQNECLGLLLRELIKQTKKKALFIQLRNFFDWGEYREVFEKYGFDYLDRLNYIIGVRGTGDEGRGTGTGNHAISNSPPPLGGGREGVEDREPKTEDHTISNSPPPVGGGREGAEEDRGPNNEDRRPKTEDRRPNINSKLKTIVIPSAAEGQNSKLFAEPSEAILQKMSASRRRQIKAGIKNGAEIIEPQNIEQVREFYDILYDLYRYKVRKPLPDWTFFESFYTFTFKNSGNRQPVTGNRIGIIRLIQFDGKIIGGILSPMLKDRCLYEWYVCGLDKEYKQQYPSVLATWAAIEYAMKNGISTFDFMGVGKPDEDYGVRDFKARFGGELVNYGRFTRINNKFLFNIAEFGYNVLALFKKI